MDLLVDYRLNTSIDKQYRAFHDGFCRVWDGFVLKLFQPMELMDLVTGNENYFWTELEKNAEYKIKLVKVGLGCVWVCVFLIYEGGCVFLGVFLGVWQCFRGGCVCFRVVCMCFHLYIIDFTYFFLINVHSLPLSPPLIFIQSFPVSIYLVLFYLYHSPI